VQFVDEGRTADEGAGLPAPRRGLENWPWWTVSWWAVGAVLGAGRLSDNSFFTHLATGRLILDGTVPHTDSYTFTATGRPWVVQSWLASAVDASIERAVGLGGVRLFQGLCVGVTLALLWVLTAHADAVLSRFVVMIGSGLVGFIWWNERPQMLAFAFIAAVLVGAGRRVSVYWSIPLFLIWVNWHGSWLLGLVVLAGTVFAREVSAPRPDSRWTRSIIVATTSTMPALAACVIGAVVSPYGTALLMFPFRLAAGNPNIKYLGEWYRPDLVSVDTLATIALAIIATIGVIRSRRWGWIPLMLVLGALSVTAVRNLPIAAIALVPMAALGVPSLGTLRAGRSPRWQTQIPVIAVIVVVVSVLIALTPPHIATEGYPVAVVEEFATRGWIATDTERLIATDTVGNYLELRDGAAASVFVDDRAEVFPTEVYADHADLVWDRGGWRAVLDRYQATLVIWAEDDELSGHLTTDAAWREVLRSGGFVGFCRIGRAAGC